MQSPASQPSTASAPSVPKRSNVLDQWRGLAMLLVLVSHGFFFTDRVNGVGRVGVNLFFFISGLLVFRSLSKGEGDRWQVTRTFWWHRFKRLYPALIAYLVLMMAIMWALGKVTELPRGSDMAADLRAFPWGASLSANYADAMFRYQHRDNNLATFIGHLWSVSCEAQFYFLAPFIFLLGGRGAARRVAIFGVILAALTVNGMVYALRGHIDSAKYEFQNAVWPMMLGFCCEYAKNRLPILSRRLVNIIMAIGLAAAAGASVLMLLKIQKTIVIAVGALAMVPCLICYTHDRPFPGKTGSFFGWIGKRTYSVYLWQQPLTISNFLPFALQPVGALLSIPVGAASFLVFEKPFLSSNRKSRTAASTPVSQTAGA